MTSPPTRTTTAVEWSVQPIALSGQSFPIARLQVRLYLGSLAPAPESAVDPGWLDTCAPLSVVPFHIHSQGLVWQSLGIRTTWSGQPCDLGRMDFWLSTDQPPYLRGPLSLLAKFARSDPPGPPERILLGLEFFLAHRAEFQLFLPPGDGRILLP